MSLSLLRVHFEVSMIWTIGGLAKAITSYFAMAAAVPSGIAVGV